MINNAYQHYYFQTFEEVPDNIKDKVARIYNTKPNDYIKVSMTIETSPLYEDMTSWTMQTIDSDNYKKLENKENWFDSAVWFNGVV